MFKQYRTIQQGEFFVIGYDMAMGGNDYSAVQFLSKTNQDVPLVYHAKETATITTNRILPVVTKLRKVTGVKPVLMPEANSGGTFEIDRVLNSPNITDVTMYKTKTGIATIGRPDENKYGWYTTSASRPKMLEELKNAIDNQLITLYDEITINEMFSFIINNRTSGWRAEAESGKHDDLIMSLAIAWQGYKTETANKLQSVDIASFSDDTQMFKGGFY